MSAIEGILAANRDYAAGFRGPSAAVPKLALVVLTCMDARLDPYGALGLRVDDAHLLRNAGGLPTEDALRSLAISQRFLGTREIAVVQHTECGMHDFDDPGFRAELAERSGIAPSWDVPGFHDVEASVRDTVEIVRSCGWIPYRGFVRGFVFHVASGELTEVS